MRSARLVEETSKLRVDLAGVEARLGEKITHSVAQSEGTLRQEIAALEVRMERRHGDLLKWAFAFWIGQVVAMTAIISALLRTI